MTNTTPSGSLGSGAPAGSPSFPGEIGGASEPTALVLINSVAVDFVKVPGLGPMWGLSLPIRVAICLMAEAFDDGRIRRDCLRMLQHRLLEVAVAAHEAYGA